MRRGLALASTLAGLAVLAPAAPAFADPDPDPYGVIHHDLDLGELQWRYGDSIDLSDGQLDPYTGDSTPSLRGVILG